MSVRILQFIYIENLGSHFYYNFKRVSIVSDKLGNHKGEYEQILFSTNFRNSSLMDFTM